MSDVKLPSIQSQIDDIDDQIANFTKEKELPDKERSFTKEVYQSKIDALVKAKETLLAKTN